MERESVLPASISNMDFEDGCNTNYKNLFGLLYFKTPNQA
jgi:hypothetical protein